ncbi:MAG: hypothetical protein GHCLOJNM_00223 [bacterium]|nr:hypothetical protein [bacterium]
MSAANVLLLIGFAGTCFAADPSPARSEEDTATLNVLVEALETLRADPASLETLRQNLQAGSVVPTVDSRDLEFFEKRVRPVLADNCFQCHGPEKQKGGLRLDGPEGLRDGGKSGPPILPGDPENSLLVRAIRYTDPALQMPPSGKLEEGKIADLVEWIRRGAPYPSPPPNGKRSLRLSVEEARQTWPYTPPKEPMPPEVRDVTWVANPIDRFILSKLENKGLHPAPPADKRTLLRRVTFDLTGLPPTPEEMEGFLADSSPGAFEKVVERLLASTHYGERWGRHWLDVVRYTDSFDSRATAEQDVTESHRYRDWVVDAYNRDMPYDQFLSYQIAGDLIPTEGPDPGFNREGIIATGLLAIGNWPGGDADKEKMVTDIVDDQIDVVMRGMLGVTFTCARCHDHKFDPFSMSDYYSLAGVFFSSHILPGPGKKTEGSPVLKIPLLSKGELAAREQETARVTELQGQIQSLVEGQKAELARARLPETGKYLLAAWRCREAGMEASAFASKEDLDPRLLEGWLGYLGFTRHPLLPKKVQNLHNLVGLSAWIAEETLPAVVANSLDKPLEYLTVIQPARSLVVHPGPEEAVGVAWRSPVSATVAVNGSVADADSKGGDGIEWRLVVETQEKDIPLAEGLIENGASQSFSEGKQHERGDGPALVTVRVGDTLLLSVGPRGNHGFDSTTVELEVHEVGGEGRTWSLAADLVSDLLAGNPHSDRLGNPAVWRFLGLGKDKRTEPEILVRWKKAIGELALDQTPVDNAARMIEEAASRIQKAIDSAAVAPDQDTPDSKLVQELLSSSGPFSAIVEESLFSEDAKGRLASLREELRALEGKSRAPIEYAVGIQEGGVPDTVHAGVHDVAVHKRGRYDNLGEVAPRGFPEALRTGNEDPIREGSGRRELARWVASSSNPLTARVLVNRLWQRHFGEGIVRTPGNFGKMGEPPTHPELLDWLAIRFVRSGWSIKAMHRLMLLSSTYRQSSAPSPELLAADPDNRWFGGMNRRRLEAEAIRDSLLAVSGRLEPAFGGPPVADLAAPRRTLYVKTVRSDRATYGALFDAADPTAIVDRRTESTVAPQALFLLNNSLPLQLTQELAERMLGTPAANTSERIARLYWLLYGRPPTAEEVELGIGFLENGPTSRRIWAEYCQVLLCANEFVYVD